MPMDTGVMPAMASFEVSIDGVPETPLGGAWQDATTLRLTLSAPAVTTLTVTLLTYDSLLRSLGGVIATAPQSITWNV